MNRVSLFNAALVAIKGEKMNVNLVRVLARDKVLMIDYSRWQSNPEEYAEAGIRGDRVLIDSKMPVLITPAQKQVYDMLVTTPKTGLEIAKDLGLTEKTVKFHATSIYKAFGVRRRTELLVMINGG